MVQKGFQAMVTINASHILDIVHWASSSKDSWSTMLGVSLVHSVLVTYTGVATGQAQASREPCTQGRNRGSQGTLILVSAAQRFFLLVWPKMVYRAD